MKYQLFNLCGFKAISQQLKLLYRGSVHGFRASEFHAKCDNIPKTLTVVKAAESGNIFGGYTEATWDEPSQGNTCYKEDKNAFIFSLVNKEKTPMKVNVAIGEERCAIIAKKKCGPIFGEFKMGHDIVIALDYGLQSYASIGSSYVVPKLKHGSDEAISFLAGSDYFELDEIEVFQLH
jgi:hypothetical protein